MKKDEIISQSEHTEVSWIDQNGTVSYIQRNDEDEEIILSNTAKQKIFYGFAEVGELVEGLISVTGYEPHRITEPEPRFKVVGTSPATPTATHIWDANTHRIWRLPDEGPEPGKVIGVALPEPAPGKVTIGDFSDSRITDWQEAMRDTGPEDQDTPKWMLDWAKERVNDPTVDFTKLKGQLFTIPLVQTGTLEDEGDTQQPYTTNLEHYPNTSMAEDVDEEPVSMHPGIADPSAETHPFYTSNEGYPFDAGMLGFDNVPFTATEEQVASTERRLKDHGVMLEHEHFSPNVQTTDRRVIQITEGEGISTVTTQTITRTTYPAGSPEVKRAEDDLMAQQRGTVINFATYPNQEPLDIHTRHLHPRPPDLSDKTDEELQKMVEAANPETMPYTDDHELAEARQRIQQLEVERDQAKRIAETNARMVDELRAQHGRKDETIASYSREITRLSEETNTLQSNYAKATEVIHQLMNPTSDNETVDTTAIAIEKINLRLDSFNKQIGQLTDVIGTMLPTPQPEVPIMDILRDGGSRIVRRMGRGILS